MNNIKGVDVVRNLIEDCFSFNISTNFTCNVRVYNRLGGMFNAMPISTSYKIVKPTTLLNVTEVNIYA